MSDEFDELLDAPFPADAELPIPPVETDRRLGFNSASITALEDAIYEDLSPELHGIGWWPASSGRWDRRILVADYLYTAMAGTRKGIREAILHSHASRQYAERVLERQRGHSQRVGDLRPPPPTCLRDELESEFLDMQVTGFFRALATALDCMAVAIVGVVPVPLAIQKVNWRPLRRNLEAMLAKPSSNDVGEQKRRGSVTEIVAALKHGVPGWIEWVIDVRNMVAHRPPRVRYRTMDLGSALSLQEPGIEQLRMINRLWRHPDVSEVEVWVQYGMPMDALLNEPQELTMSRLVTEVSRLAEKLFGTLEAHWQWRRQNPNALLQPIDKQWPDREQQPDYVEFPGFMPEHPKPTVGRMVVAPQAIRRMEAAAMNGPNIMKWDRHYGRAVRRPGLAMPARVRWLSAEEGGRAEPPGNAPYSTVAKFRDQRADWSRQAWSVMLAFTSWPNMAIVSFLVPEAPHDLLATGVAFELYEGAKKVAEVEVL
jgi:hypothetical protein